MFEGINGFICFPLHNLRLPHEEICQMISNAKFYSGIGNIFNLLKAMLRGVEVSKVCVV